MPRHCPDCKAQMRDDGINCWCVQADCSFSGYVDLQTGRIDRDQNDDHPDEWDDRDDDGFDDCGMTEDGTCVLAGTEHCDWDCPHSG
ncbi:hypothetical protein [Pseudooceanicola sp.]|uniref:hypothetical protein n=1 Tax=Pseudooceanicola sp. TaxID=1914328 RepID=UPI0035127EB1